MRTARISDMRQRQILEVKEVYALAKDLRLMVLLDPEALSRVPPPETLLKDCQNIWVRHGLRESFWGGQSWPNRLDLQGFLFRRWQVTGSQNCLGCLRGQVADATAAWRAVCLVPLGDIDLP